MLKEICKITGTFEEQMKHKPEANTLGPTSLNEATTSSSSSNLSTSSSSNDGLNKSNNLSEPDSDNYLQNTMNTMRTSLLCSVNLMDESIASLQTVKTETEEDEFQCLCFGRCNCVKIYNDILNNRNNEYDVNTSYFEKKFKTLTKIQEGDKLFINDDDSIEIDRGFVISNYKIHIPGLQKLTRFYYKQDRARTNAYIEEEINNYMKLLTTIQENLERMSANKLFQNKYYSFKKIIERNLSLIQNIIIGLYNLKKTYTENGVCVYRPLAFNIDSIIFTFMDFISNVKKISSNKFEGGIGSGIQFNNEKFKNAPILERITRQRSDSF